MHKIIRPIERPRCQCGGSTYLERVESHPIHGKGFEVRVFACKYCGTETTSETTPDDVDFVLEPSDRDTVLSMMADKLRSISRLMRSRSRFASTERTFPIARKAHK
jgi:hypothetical protein